MKKLIALLLTLSLMIGTALPVLAENGSETDGPPVDQVTSATPGEETVPSAGTENTARTGRRNPGRGKGNRDGQSSAPSGSMQNGSPRLQGPGRGRNGMPGKPGAQQQDSTDSEETALSRLTALLQELLDRGSITKEQYDLLLNYITLLLQPADQA